MAEVKIASIEQINSCRERWNNLVKSMEFPTVFLTWEWVTTWVKHFGKEYELVVLFLYDAVELVAILPLAQTTIRLEDGFLRAKIITICGSLELSPDHLDIICAKGDDAKSYIEDILNFLTCNYNVWDILYLAFLAEEAKIASWIHSMHTEFRLGSSKTIAPYIMNENGLSAFFNKMPRKKRYNLNREKNILFKKKNVYIENIVTQKKLKKGLDDLFRLHETRADQKGVKSTFKGNEVYDFHKEISQTFLENGWLRFYLLKVGNNSIASAYGFVFERKFYFYQTGMDPEWQKYSPGKILIFSILEDLFADDIFEFDFLGGNDAYKTFWTKNTRTMVTFKVYNRNMIGSIEYWANSFRFCFKSLLKKIPFINVLQCSLNRE